MRDYLKSADSYISHRCCLYYIGTSHLHGNRDEKVPYFGGVYTITLTKRENVHNDKIHIYPYMRLYNVS